MGKTLPLHKKQKSPYKYAINDQLNMLPRTMKTNDVVEHLKTFGISRNEFYSDRKIAWGSKKSISADRLIIYAKVFDCTTDELVLDKVKATSIRQSKLNLKNALS
jgi:hypothetical protein